jgi:threonyl-tRNA synthetase
MGRKEKNNNFERWNKKESPQGLCFWHGKGIGIRNQFVNK